MSGAQDPKATTEQLRALYDGDRSATMALLKQRFISSSLTIAQVPGYDESTRNMLVENELRPLVDERIEAVPSDFSFEPDSEMPECEEPEELRPMGALPERPATEAPEGGPGLVEAESGQGPEPEDESVIVAEPSEAETLAADIQEWAEGPCTPEGHDLYALFDKLKADQEIAGTAIVVLGRFGSEDPARPGEVWVQDRDGAEEAAEPTYGNPSNPREITAWKFTWYEGARKVVETYDSTNIVVEVDGKRESKTPHGFGFMPVVVAPRRFVRGKAHGDSGIKEMEEAYLNFLWASYMRNVANKFTAFRVWVPADDVTLMMVQGDSDGTGMTRIRVMPGAVLKGNFEARGGDISLESIENQRADSLETLRRIGRGEEDSDKRSDQRVAKAMVIGRRGMERYAAGKCVFLKAMLLQIATMRHWILNPGSVGKPIPVCVEFADQRDADPAVMLDRAKLWLEAFKAKLAKPLMVFKQWQRLKLLDEDAPLEAMAAEIDALGEADAIASMERMAALGAAKKPGESAPKPPSSIGGDI